MTQRSREERDSNSVNGLRRSTTLTGLLAVCALAGCRRAPTFSILGSFFPAWLICMVAGVVLAVIANRVLVYFKLDKVVVWQIVVYPCLALFFACMLWLIFFS